MKATKTIPLQKQDANAVGGIEIEYLVAKDAMHDVVLTDHMDDHYGLAFITKGKCSMVCDMVEVKAKVPGLIIIKPYQVHAVKQMSANTEGFFMSIAPFVIPAYCNDVFTNLQPLQQRIKPQADAMKALVQLSKLIHEAFNSGEPNKTFIIKGLLDALLYRIAGMCQNPVAELKKPANQASLLSFRFRELLAQHSFLNTPSFFAEKLHITTAHLNDCVKATTGFSLTYWLQNAMVLEAKRYLYYTSNDVKEIAFDLGYEDHAYFSRLFKKVTGETPLSFRSKFRE